MDFDNVFKFKFKKSDYNRPLIELSNLDFIDLCESFIDCRLIYGDEQRETFTAHPLVKTYFEINFNNEHKILFHRRIYEYLDEISKLKPKTLEEMRPVFEQIYHGCQARMYNKAYEVYSKKIQRGDKYFLLYELDAWNSCIKVLENFFNNKTIQHNAIIPSIKNKGEILCTAGLAMRMTNRFSEAKTLYKEAIKADIDRKDWENAAIDYQNLAHLQIIEAELINSIDSSKKAIELSRSAKNKNREWRATAWLAYTLFLAGKMEEALEKYEYANKLVKKSEPSLKYIYSGWGVRYSDFLLAKGEIENALNVTLENLNVCKKRKWISYVNFCHYSLAAIYRHQNKLEKAEDEILLAIGSSRYSGDRDRATEYFIELAKIRIDQRSYEDAIDILKEALLTCEKNSYCLLQIEAELLLAESYFEISNFRESKKLAKSAFLNAEKSNYYWVKIKSEGLLKRLK